MKNPSVVIVGAGPTGLTLAAELKLAGAEVLLVERRASQEFDGSRAGGLHARTIEVFDQRGIADRFLKAGKAMQVAGFGMTPLDLSDFPTRHNYGLALWQIHIEKILAAWVDELNVPIRRSCSVTGITQDDSGVTVTLSDGESLRAEYLVGCDGGRSFVRKAAGIEFPGWDPTVSHILAEVEFAQEPQWGMRNDARGMYGISKMDDGPKCRVMITEDGPGASSDPTLEDLSAELKKLYGSDFGVHSPHSISRFTDMARQAATYRAGRVLLAGDSAHVHYPAGGQGLNIGVQDAVNLGWKLAQVIKGTSPSTLLDTYHSERHPVAARVLKLTLAQVALRRTDERSKALNETVSELLKMDEPRKRYAGIMSGLELHYDLGKGHPLLGRRMPDLELVGGKRVFELLHEANAVLLNFAAPIDLGAWSDRVRNVDARYEGKWELPLLGIVSAPSAVLIRPDGYVAWVGEGTEQGLREALTTWFGA